MLNSLYFSLQINYNNGESRDSPCNLFKKTIKTSSLFDGESTSTLSWLPMSNNMLLVASDEGTFKVSKFIFLIMAQYTYF